VDGIDDLVVVDSLKVRRRHAEVRVTELPLDEVDRNAIACHLNGMRVTQLVRCEPAPDSGLDGQAA
jgi:hypothetical protein